MSARVQRRPPRLTDLLRPRLLAEEDEREVDARKGKDGDAHKEDKVEEHLLERDDDDVLTSARGAQGQPWAGLSAREEGSGLTDILEHGEGQPREEDCCSAGKNVKREVRDSRVVRPEAVRPEAEIAEEDGQEGEVET